MDPDYEAEWTAAGPPAAVLHFEALDDPDRALRFVEGTGAVLYRGWMMPVNAYGRLCEALSRRGLVPMVSAEAYRAGHWLPGWYPFLEGETPRSAWGAPVPSLLAEFGERPVIVKDYVKSRKHEWAEACFIPSAVAGEEVVRRFLERQGEDLAGGVVIREFVDLEGLGPHPVSGMPRAREWRLFLWQGRLLAAFAYWGGDEALPEGLPVERFERLAGRVPSPFLSMDVARTAAGEWIVVEVGDGQVSGLPDAVDPARLYGPLRAVSG